MSLVVILLVCWKFLAYVLNNASYCRKQDGLYSRGTHLILFISLSHERGSCCPWKSSFPPPSLAPLPHSGAKSRSCEHPAACVAESVTQAGLYDFTCGRVTLYCPGSCLMPATTSAAGSSALEAVRSDSGAGAHQAAIWRAELAPQAPHVHIYGAPLQTRTSFGQKPETSMGISGTRAAYVTLLPSAPAWRGNFISGFQFQIQA